MTGDIFLFDFDKFMVLIVVYFRYTYINEIAYVDMWWCTVHIKTKLNHNLFSLTSCLVQADQNDR